MAEQWMSAASRICCRIWQNHSMMIRSLCRIWACELSPSSIRKELAEKNLQKRTCRKELASLKWQSDLSALVIRHCEFGVSVVDATWNVNAHSERISPTLS
jgi:hypothetical protein